MWYLVFIALMESLDFIRCIQFQDINIFVVTDTHSWVDAHRHPDHAPSLDATYGNITSFIVNMKKNAALYRKDVFFLDNGDVVDGTG